MGQSVYPGIGPQNSDIAAAVAAPSSSTIATAVAAAVPTRANIQSDIQTYAAPASLTTSAIVTAGNAAGWASIGGGTTWTVVATPSVAGTNTYTFSSLSGYKFYRLVISGLSSAADTYLQIRINGDVNGNYNYSAFGGNQGGSTNTYALGMLSDTYIRPNGGYQTASKHNLIWDTTEANLTGAKICTSLYGGNNSSTGWWHQVNGISSWTGTAAITSITIFLTSGNFGGTGSVTLYGGN